MAAGQRRESGLGCSPGWTPALFVTHRANEEAYAVLYVTVNVTFTKCQKINYVRFILYWYTYSSACWQIEPRKTQWQAAEYILCNCKKKCNGSLLDVQRISYCTLFGLHGYYEWIRSVWPATVSALSKSKHLSKTHKTTKRQTKSAWDYAQCIIDKVAVSFNLYVHTCMLYIQHYPMHLHAQ